MHNWNNNAHETMAVKQNKKSLRKYWVNNNDSSCSRVFWWVCWYSFLLKKSTKLFPSNTKYANTTMGNHCIGSSIGWIYLFKNSKISFIIYRKTKNIRAVQLLLGHSSLESTVRYLGIDEDDALTLAEQIEVWVRWWAPLQGPPPYTSRHPVYPLWCLTK